MMGVREVFMVQTAVNIVQLVVQGKFVINIMEHVPLDAKVA